MAEVKSKASNEIDEPWANSEQNEECKTGRSYAIIAYHYYYYYYY